MMYHKINSPWKRDPETKFQTFLSNQWSEHEFDVLKDLDWFWHEKIDGTNIRFHKHEDEVWSIHGRTERAQIPQNLFFRLLEIRDELVEEAQGLPVGTTIFGEGYGAGIQKVGREYLEDHVDFIAFDIHINGIWLEPISAAELAGGLGLDFVPLIGYGTLEEAQAFVAQGFRSSIGTAMAEGLVLRPPLGLLTRTGRRIITKLKTRDFENV